MINQIKIIRIRPENGWIITAIIDEKPKASKNLTDADLIKILGEYLKPLITKTP